MRELSIQITVYPVTSMRQDLYRFIADDLLFAPVPENTEAGICFNCNTDITIDLPPINVLRDFQNGRFGIIEFRDTKHKSFRVGDKKIPAIVTVYPNLNSATLKIECKMLKSPLL